MLRADATAQQAQAPGLAGIAHDLRQPLDALAIYADLLAADPSLADELAPRIQRAVAAAQGLVQTLAEGPAQAARVAVPELLADLRAVHEPAARQKGLRFRVRGLHASVHAEPAALHSLLGNLLGNAIRYTDRGGVLLAARRRGGGVSLEVWDTGRGIAAQDQQRVFEPYCRVNALEDAPGQGLGLAIARDAAAQLGVQITLRSRPGRGSVFKIITS